VTSFIVHEIEIEMGVPIKTPKNVHLKCYSKFYMECRIEFDSLGLKYKERFKIHCRV